jgi:hypothetical protein
VPISITLFQLEKMLGSETYAFPVLDTVTDISPIMDGTCPTWRYIT